MNALVVIVLLSLAIPRMALACTCIPQPADQEAAVRKALDEAAVVFLGRIEHAELNGEDQSGSKLQRTRFQVLQFWKGELSSQVYVHTRLSMCGSWFPHEGEYLVYGYVQGEDGYFSTSACTRTKPSSSALDEVALLNRIQAADDGRTIRSSRSREERAPAER